MKYSVIIYRPKLNGCLFFFKIFMFLLHFSLIGCCLIYTTLPFFAAVLDCFIHTGPFYSWNFAFCFRASTSKLYRTIGVTSFITAILSGNFAHWSTGYSTMHTTVTHFHIVTIFGTISHISVMLFVSPYNGKYQNIYTNE